MFAKIQYAGHDSKRSGHMRRCFAVMTIAAFMVSGSEAWAHSNNQLNDTVVTSPKTARAEVGMIIEAKAVGGLLTPGMSFNLKMASETSGHSGACEHGQSIAGPKQVNEEGNIGRVSGTVPLRLKGIYDVCFISSDNSVQTFPIHFVVR